MKGKKILAASLGVAIAVQTFQTVFVPVTVEAGVHQESVSVFVDIYTDKAMYGPGDPVEITVKLENRTQRKITALSMQPMHLNEKVGVPVVVPCEVDEFSDGAAKINWTAPDKDFQGYLLEITALTADGTYLDSGSVAVDVSSSWTKFPRYGYVHDFGEYADAQDKIDEMTKYHMNVVEYYDWQYLHHQPLAPEEMLEKGYYEDWSGRKIYVSAIKDYISAAKSANMVSMAYDMIYAGTDTFFEGEENEGHRNWQIHFKEDNDRGNGPFYFTMGSSPSGNGHLYFVNPLNTEWQNHIFSEINKVFAYFDFDGWHGDTVGDWGEMTTSQGEPLGYTEDGEPIHMVLDTYTQFLNAAKSALGDRYLTFNPVGAKGIENANVSNVDALYTEFWPWDHDRYWDGETEDANRYDTYGSLAKEVERSAMESGGKSLTVKAYINYGAMDGYMNTPAVILSNASVLAAGGSKLEIGNGDSILHKEYYPDDKVPMSDQLKARMRNMYDFEVAYENLLRDGQETTSQMVVTEGYVNSSDGQSDTIWTYTRKGNGYQILHMMNLLGTDNQWRDEYKEKAIPEAAENIPVKYYYTDDVNCVYMDSPDRNSGSTEALQFEKGEDENGAYVTFEVPSLEYWNMIYMSSEEATELNNANTNMQYKMTFEGEDYYEGNLSEGQADLQPGESIAVAIPEGMKEGEYQLSIVSCGNRQIYYVEKNGEAAGILSRTGTGFGMNEMTEDYMEGLISLAAGDVIKIYDNGVDGSGYGWVDKLVLTLKRQNQTGQQETLTPYVYPDGMLYKVEGESGETYAMDTVDNHPEVGIYGEASEHKLMKNIGLNQGWVTLTIPEEVPEDDYKLVLSYSSGSDGKVNVWVNDTQYTLDYKLTDKTWSFAPAEISIPSVKLKAGDKIKIQDAKENCWIWVDYIYLMEEENVCSKLPFADVEKGDWYYEYVAAVYERALMTGLDKDIFGPAENLSRAQLAEILYRMEDTPEVVYTKKFPDVLDDFWYSDAIMWASENDIVTGYAHSGTFGPADSVTREQMAVMMYRYANYKDWDVSGTVSLERYPDGGSVSEFAKKAMEWAVGTGIITGEDGKLNPQGRVNRAVCATIMTRMWEVYQ